MFLPGLGVVILHNVIVETEDVLGCLECCENDYQMRNTNANFQFLMFLFFMLYHLMLSGNFKGR